MRPLLLLTVSLAMSPALASCRAFDQPGKVGTRAVQLNRAIEDAHNEILLLNIVRASKRLPQHWSALTVLRTNESLQVGSGALSVPFGGGATTDNYSVAPSATVTTTPSMEMAVQVSEEFTRGMMQQVSLEQLRVFQEQGWNRALLFHLMTREIEITMTSQPKDGGAAEVLYRKRLENRPVLDENGTYREYEEFCGALNQFLELGLEIGPRPAKKPADPSAGIPLSELTGEGLAALSDKGFVVKEVDGRILATPKPAGGLTLRFSKLPPGLSPGLTVGQVEPQREEKEIALSIQTDQAAMDDEQALAFEKLTAFLETSASESNPIDGELMAEASGSQPKVTVRFRLRSPEGLIYFLGEVLRTQTTEYPLTPTYRSDGQDYAYFSAVLGDSPDSPISVEHGGERVSIPALGTDRTLTTMTFCSLLINLNRARKELPVSSIVTVST